MTVLELVFLLTVVATLAALVTAAITVFRRRPRAAARVLGLTALALTAYLGLGLAVSAARPQRLLSEGAPWCFDDWCLTADRVATQPAEGGTSGTTVTVALRLESRARRVSQHANGAWIYLLGSDGHRYDPDPDPRQVPLDVELAPGEAVPTARTFTLPRGVQPTGLLTGHGGPYCGAMSYLVIGDAGCLFGKPTMIAFHRGVAGVP